MNPDNYVTLTMPLDALYGASTRPLLDALTQRYSGTGVDRLHWVLRVYPNGAAIPTPTCVTDEVMPAVRPIQLFKQSIDTLSSNAMHKPDEADTFLLDDMRLRLDEICGIGVA